MLHNAENAPTERRPAGRGKAPDEDPTSTIRIRLRRPWPGNESIFLLGPGGVGKSTLGLELSRRMGWPLVDLDDEFCRSIAVIGQFIEDNGYQTYRDENLKLATRLVTAADTPRLFVTSSGFLAAPPGSDDHRIARALVETGYGITLLPALDLEQASALVVERQLARGYGLQRAEEARKFAERFEIYRDEGDMLVVSTSPVPDVADALEREMQTAVTLSRHFSQNQTASVSDQMPHLLRA